MQVSQTTSKSTGTRVHCSLPLFPQLHLKTLVATKVNLCSHFGLRGSSQCPPRDTNICDVWRMLACCDGHMQQLTTLNQTKCTWALTERCCSPMEAVLVAKWVALPGFANILKVHPLVWTWVILTQANTLCTVEGSRLLWQGHTRCVDTYACFEYLTTQMSQVKEPTHTACGPFVKSYVTSHMCGDQ